MWNHQLEAGVTFTGEHRDWIEKLHCPCSTTAGLAFLDDDQLVIYQVFYVPDRLTSRSPREVEQSQYVLKFVSFDLAHGTYKEGKELPTNAEWTIVKKTCCGWAIRTGNELRLTGEDFDPRVKIDLPDTRNSDFAISPSGKSVLVSFWDSKKGEYWAYDLPSYSEKAKWTGNPGLGFGSITDQSILWLLNNGEVDVGDFAKPLEPFFSCRDINCRSAEFLNGADIGVSAAQSLAVYRKGNRVFTEKLCKDCVANIDAPASLDGVHFLAAVSTKKRTSWFDSGIKTVSEQVNVYDLKQLKKVFSVPVNPLPTHHFQTALSPDGAMLAILNDWNVSVYRIGPQT